MKNDRVLVCHIIESVDKIEKFIEGMDFEHFEADDKTMSAVVRELTVIGEAVMNLSEEFTKKYNQIPFHEVAGMRNRIVHEYWSVDVEVVWKTCQEDVLTLKEVLEKT